MVGLDPSGRRFDPCHPDVDYKARRRELYHANPGSQAERSRRYYDALKAEVLEHYGTRCAECGFSDARALCIDHINDDGAAERRKLFGVNRKGGVHFYRYLKRNGWPAGYQTLCANCNLIKEVERQKRLQRERIMAYGSDGRYYATADFKGKAGKAAKEKFEARAAEAQKGEDAKSDPEVVEAPKPDGDKQVRDNAGSTVPLTGDNVTNPKTPGKNSTK